MAAVESARLVTEHPLGRGVREDYGSVAVADEQHAVTGVRGHRRLQRAQVLARHSPVLANHDHGPLRLAFRVAERAAARPNPTIGPATELHIRQDLAAYRPVEQGPQEIARVVDRRKLSGKPVEEDLVVPSCRGGWNGKPLEGVEGEVGRVSVATTEAKLRRRDQVVPRAGTTADRIVVAVPPGSSR